jgi:hypothetical protein
LPRVLPGPLWTQDVVIIPPNAVSLPELPSRLLILFATLGAILAPGMTIFPVLDAAVSLRVKSFLHTWHLRQLAPPESGEG